MTQQSRQCIVLLGVHGSGLSAMAGCLGLVGINTGTVSPDEIPNQPLVRAHDVLMRDLGHHWDMIGSLPKGWVDSDPGRRAHQRLAGIVEERFMGRGPLETKAYIIDDLVLVRLRNVLTQAELKLAGSCESKDGRELVKRVRITLLEQGRPLLEAAVEKILGVKVKSLHTDISTITGERVILFSLMTPPAIL